MFKPRFEIASVFQKIKLFKVENFIIQETKVALLSSVNCFVFITSITVFANISYFIISLCRIFILVELVLKHAGFNLSPRLFQSASWSIYCGVRNNGYDLNGE